MGPIDSDDVGLTLRELVLEVRTDVREMKEDLIPRVQALETDSVATKKVAAALLTQKKDYITKRQKVYGAVFAVTTLFLNALALGPDILHF